MTETSNPCPTCGTNVQRMHPTGPIPRYCSADCKPRRRRPRVPLLQKRKTGPKPIKPELRFWAKVDTTGGPDACWPWTASRVAEGYGKFYLGRVGRQHVLVPAHRFAYEDQVGPIPEGYEVDHQCHVAGECFGNEGCPHRRCVNPAHLKAMTPRENVLRGNTIVAAQASRTHCPQGHEYDEANTYWNGRKRTCQTCACAYQRERYWASRGSQALAS